MLTTALSVSFKINISRFLHAFVDIFTACDESLNKNIDE